MKQRRQKIKTHTKDENPSDLWNNIKWSNIWVFGRVQEEWKKFWRNNGNFFSNLMKTIILQIKEGQRTPSITNIKRKKKKTQSKSHYNEIAKNEKNEIILQVIKRKS